jgi:hypothetical protein
MYSGMLADRNCHRSTNARVSRLIMGPARDAGLACVRICELRRIAGLESYGLTKILLAGGDSATNPAKKLSVLYKGLVLLRAAELKTKIVQITKVLIVAGVRQTCLCHKFISQKEFSNSDLFQTRDYIHCQDNQRRLKVQAHPFLKTVFGTTDSHGLNGFF